jgi:hypothetical protein
MDWLFLILALFGVGALINISNRLDLLARTAGQTDPDAMERTLRELLETTRRIENSIDGWLADHQVDPEDEFDAAG